MTAFWNAPVADIVSRSNLIDDIAMDHALDRMIRMRPATHGLRLDRLHRKGDPQSNGSDLLVAFEGEKGSFFEARVSGPEVRCSITGGPRDASGFIPFSTSFVFPSDTIEGMEDPSTPAKILERWIDTLSIRTTPLQNNLDRIGDGAVEIPFRNALVDACALIAAYNPKRSPDVRTRLICGIPGTRPSLVDRSGRGLIRRETENRILSGLPVPLNFEIRGLDHFILSRVEFSIRQGMVPYDPIGVMRTLAERDIRIDHDPLLSAARRPD